MIFAVWLALVAQAAPAEKWVCETHRGIAERHHAYLDLKTDGSFSLRHTNTTPYAGTMTDMDGTWRRDGGELVLVPTVGERRFWIGDSHRFMHEQDIAFCTWKEPLPGHERRLRVASVDGIELLNVPELNTKLGRDGDRRMACSDHRPSPSPSRGYKCERPARPQGSSSGRRPSGS